MKIQLIDRASGGVVLEFDSVATAKQHIAEHGVDLSTHSLRVYRPLTQAEQELVNEARQLEGGEQKYNIFRQSDDIYIGYVSMTERRFAEYTQSSGSRCEVPLSDVVVMGPCVIEHMESPSTLVYLL